MLNGQYAVEVSQVLSGMMTESFVIATPATTVTADFLVTQCLARYSTVSTYRPSSLRYPWSTLCLTLSEYCPMKASSRPHDITASVTLHTPTPPAQSEKSEQILD